jgi:catecholate siderophore receptor
MADYSHTYLNGLPDFGVPYNLPGDRPVTEGVVPRNTYYGIVNRDFTKTTQNLGTLDGEYKVNDWLTLANKFRQGYSILNYIGTIPENPSGAGINPIYVSTPTYLSGYTQLNPQSRFETAAVLVDQPELTAKFDTGPFNHAAVFGSEFSHERISINSYTGLTSEGNAGEGLFSPSGAPIVSIYDPTNFLTGLGSPTLGNNPQIYNVDTKAVYLLDTAKISQLKEIGASSGRGFPVMCPIQSRRSFILRARNTGSGYFWLVTDAARLSAARLKWPFTSLGATRTGGKESGSAALSGLGRPG